MISWTTVDLPGFLSCAVNCSCVIIVVLRCSTFAMGFARCQRMSGGGVAVLGAAVAVWLAVATMSTTTDAAAVLEGDYGEWARSAGGRARARKGKPRSEEQRLPSYGLTHAMPSCSCRRSCGGVTRVPRRAGGLSGEPCKVRVDAAQPGVHARGLPACLRAWLLSPVGRGIFDAYFRPVQNE